MFNDFDKQHHKCLICVEMVNNFFIFLLNFRDFHCLFWAKIEMREAKMSNDWAQLVMSATHAIWRYRVACFPCSNWTINATRWFRFNFLIITRGQFCPLGIVVACVYVCVCPCVCASTPSLSMCHDSSPFKLGSPSKWYWPSRSNMTF